MNPDGQPADLQPVKSNSSELVIDKAAASLHSVERSQSAAGELPDVVPAAQHIETQRRDRLKSITRITLLGILIRFFVIAIEAVGFWLSGSQTLLADLIASLFDSLASLALLGVVYFAARPPDNEHPFGHGRAEPLAGFQLALFLSATGLWLGISNVFAISRPHLEHSVPSWIWMIPAVATVMLAVVTYWINEVGKRTASTALKAESSHFAVDTATSLLTTFALVFAALFPAWNGTFDYAGGILLALIMVVLGMSSAWQNLHPLLDRIPESDELDRVRKSALKVAGVIEVEKLRIQQAGPDAHVNIDIEVDPEISVDAGHLIAQRVRTAIQSDWPLVRDVVVHVEPHNAGAS